jgi:ketosteroid isomerase-like protein
MVSRVFVVGLVCVTGVLGCRLEHLPPGKMMADSETLEGIITTFHESLTADDWEVFRGLFVEDASVSGMAGVGAQTIGGFWSGVRTWVARTGAGQFDAIPSRIEIRHTGNVATAWLTSTWTVDPSGVSPTVMEHRALFVFLRHGDGWRLVTTLLDRRSASTVS